MLNVPHRGLHLFLHSKFRTGRNTCFEGIQQYLQGRALGVNYAKKPMNWSISHSNYTYSAELFSILQHIQKMSLTFSSVLVKQIWLN